MELFTLSLLLHQRFRVLGCVVRKERVGNAHLVSDVRPLVAREKSDLDGIVSKEGMFFKLPIRARDSV